MIVRETNAEAWAAADDLIKHVTDETIGSAQKIFSRMDSVGQQRMAQLHGGRRDKLEIGPNLWAGVGLVRGGAGTALVGDPATVAARIREYQQVGIDTFIMSGYPHLEEAYRFAELVFPLLELERPRNVTPIRVNTGPFGETIANEQRPLQKVAEIMSVIDSLPRARSGRWPGADGLIQWIVPLAIILIWQVACMTGLVSERVLPAPSEVVRSGWKLLLSGELERNIWVSFWRAGIGFLIGGGIGFAFGLANGLSELSSKLTDTTLQMVRNVPHLALIPLVILWFGIDETAKLFLVGLGVFFPIYLNTLHGIRTVDPQLIEMGRIYGMRDGELFRRVIFPGALPSIFVGVRFALGIMWLTLIVAETIAASSGLGYMAMQAREFMQIDVVVLSILIYALLGKLADSASRVLERFTLAWHPAFRKKS